MCAQQNIAYADLMKPDEDWRGLRNTAERRKIQNRIAQRAYRRNVQRKTSEVEELKKQLQKFQQGREPESPPISPRQGPSEITDTETTAPKQMTRKFWTTAQDHQNSQSESSPVLQTKSTPRSSFGLSGYPLAPASPLSNTKLPDCQDPVQIADLSVSTLTEDLFLVGPPTPSSLDAGFHHARSQLTFPEGDFNFDLQPSSSIGTRPRVASSEVSLNTAPLLHLAIAGNHSEVVKVLLQEAEILINERDSAGFTPLQRAVMLGRTEIVSQLLEHGADVKYDEP